jgi:hypothetical protein
MINTNRCGQHVAHYEAGFPASRLTKADHTSQPLQITGYLGYDDTKEVTKCVD